MFIRIFTGIDNYVAMPLVALTVIHF